MRIPRYQMTRREFAERFGVEPEPNVTGILLRDDETGEAVEYFFVAPQHLKPESAVWLNPHDHALGWIIPAKAKRDIEELKRIYALD
jgi:hypothetical protein